MPPPQRPLASARVSGTAQYRAPPIDSLPRKRKANTTLAMRFNTSTLTHTLKGRGCLKNCVRSATSAHCTAHALRSSRERADLLARVTPAALGRLLQRLLEELVLLQGIRGISLRSGLVFPTLAGGDAAAELSKECALQSHRRACTRKPRKVPRQKSRHLTAPVTA